MGPGHTLACFWLVWVEPGKAAGAEPAWSLGHDHFLAGCQHCCSPDQGRASGAEPGASTAEP